MKQGKRPKRSTGLHFSVEILQMGEDSLFIYLIYQFGLQRVMKERAKVMEGWMGDR